MFNAIGLIEYKTIAAGIAAADQMVKTAEVDVLSSQIVFPGKYIILFRGKLSAINAVIEKGKQAFVDQVIDHFVLGNPHPSVFSAIENKPDIGEVEALGIIETSTVASIIVAADIAAKTAQIQLIEMRMAQEMGGKAYVLITGELAAVEASIQNASKYTKEHTTYVNHSIIPNPDKKLWDELLK